MAAPTNSNDEEGIRRQMDFYLGDVNMARDGFFRKHHKSSPECWINLSVFTSSPRFKAIELKEADISKAILGATTPSEVLEISDDRTMVRRKNRKLPHFVSPKDCKVLVNPVREGMTEEEIHEIFSKFGQLYSVYLRNDSATIHFINPNDAAKAISQLKKERTFTRIELLKDLLKRINKQRKNNPEDDDEEDDEETRNKRRKVIGKRKNQPSPSSTTNMCLLGPVASNIDRQVIINALKPYSKHGDVSVFMKKIKRSKFSDVSPEILVKPLVDIRVKFKHQNDTTECVQASKEGKIVIEKKTISLEVLTNKQVEDFFDERINNGPAIVKPQSILTEAERNEEKEIKKKLLKRKKEAKKLKQKAKKQMEEMEENEENEVEEKMDEEKIAETADKPMADEEIEEPRFIPPIGTRAAEMTEMAKALKMKFFYRNDDGDNNDVKEKEQQEKPARHAKKPPGKRKLERQKEEQETKSSTTTKEVDVDAEEVEEMKDENEESGELEQKRRKS